MKLQQAITRIDYHLFSFSSYLMMSFHQQHLTSFKKLSGPTRLII